MPGSAVLVFDIELLELVAGLPEGYMFVWNGEVSPNLFEEIDKNGDGDILLEEVRALWDAPWQGEGSGMWATCSPSRPGISAQARPWWHR